MRTGIWGLDSGRSGGRGNDVGKRKDIIIRGVNINGVGRGAGKTKGGGRGKSSTGWRRDLEMEHLANY